MTKTLLLAALCFCLTSGRVRAEETPPKLEAGKSFTVPFPDLPPTLYEMTAKKGTKPVMTIALPKNFDPARKHPLLVFLGGGDGGPATNANVARSLSEDQDFVCVALPLFRESLEPAPAIGIRENDFRFMWPLYKKMLAKLDQVVPNIDPAHRVVGGFSNGGHTTAGMIDFVGPEFLAYFNGFLFVEGGGKLEHFDRLKDKPLLVLYGGARGRDWETLLGKPAREAGVRITLHKMEDVGHAFPAAQYPAVRTWLRDLLK